MSQTPQLFLPRWSLPPTHTHNPTLECISPDTCSITTLLMFTFWFYIDSDRQKWGENIVCNHKITHFGAVTFWSQLCSDEQGPILHRTCSLPLLPTARSHAPPPAPDLPMQLQPAVLLSCSLCPRCRAAGTSSLAKFDPHWGVVPFLYPGASFVAFSFFADGSLHFLAFPFRPRMVSFCLLKQAALQLTVWRRALWRQMFYTFLLSLREGT